MELTRGVVKFDLEAEPVNLAVQRSRTGLSHREISTFHVQGGSLVGMATLECSASTNFWEVHDDGDELLIVISGKLVFKLLQPDGAETSVPIAAGQCILIPSGWSHAAQYSRRQQ